MKKLVTIIAICILFLVTPMVSAISIQKTGKNILPKADPEWDGTFTGYIGFPDQESDEPKIVGTIYGSYRYNGQKGGLQGIMTGLEEKSAEFGMLFKKPFLVGRIKAEQGNIPLVGFIGFKQETNEFGGRFMSIKGPAPYFWGTYQKD